MMYIRNLCGIDEVFYSVVRPAAKGILNEDLKIFLFDCPSRYNLTLDYIRNSYVVCENINVKKYSENKNSIIICNRAWHSTEYSGTTSNLSHYFRGIGLPVDDNNLPINMKEEFKLMGEKFVKGKSDMPIASIVKDDVAGYTVIYLSFSLDFFNYKDASVKYLKDVFTKLALSYINPDIFSNEIRALKNEGKAKQKVIKFVSIDEKCGEIIKDDNDKEAVIEEMLEKVDYKNVIPLINAYIRNKRVNVKKEEAKAWLRKWAESKWKFYLLFGRSFYVKASSEIKKDVKMLQAQINELKYSFPEYAVTLDSFPIEFFCENTMNLGDASWALFEYKPWQRGMKLSKYLSGLFQNQKFDTQFSMIIQDNFVKANLTHSIDPFDYLTSSINKNGWRSCHNVYDGEYKRGPISYMFDKSSIVAYLSNNKTYDYNVGGYSFRGNSKICRQMIHMGTDTDMMIFSRLYPQHYVNEEIYVFIRSVLEETISKFCGIENFWKTKKNGAKFEGCYKNTGSHHYDDIRGNETMLVKHKGFKSSKYAINIGSQILCPICNASPVTNGSICNHCKPM